MAALTQVGFPINRIDSIHADSPHPRTSWASARGAEATQFEFEFGDGPPGHLPGMNSRPRRDRRIARWIATAGGCGYAPYAPGTAGSAAGVALYLGLLASIGDVGGADAAARVGTWAAAGFGTLGFSLLLLGMIVLLSLVGVWAASSAEQFFGRKDDGRIVIDEVVGQLIALTPLSMLLGSHARFSSILIGVVTGFVLFRVFDVWKPGVIRWSERRFEGGLGVMADDIVAGVYAAVALIFLCSVAMAFAQGAG